MVDFPGFDITFASSNHNPMKQLIASLKKQLKGYQKLVSMYEKRGLENLDYEETEFYGAYLGKVELLQDLIPRLEKLK